MAQELGKDLTIAGVLPSFKILASDNDQIKIALIEQVNSIASFLIENNYQGEEYQRCVGIIVPILNEFLYDKRERVKEKAVVALVEFWDLLTPEDRGDYILKFMLELAHEEDDEKARVTALQILNEVAGKLDVELWEKFIVKEIKSLAIDPYSLVRKNVAANLGNVWKSITRDWFLNEIFPLLSALGKDKEDDVRNSWVEQVSHISKVCPPAIRTGELEKLYLNFMKDKNKKVKLNSFKYLGLFLDTLKDQEIDGSFLDMFVDAGLKTKNKEILYQWAYNIPGILYILKVDSWEALEELYLKLSKSPDPRIKKTLAHSIHEIAKIIGTQLTEDLLIDILKGYLKDGLKEVRSGVVKVS
jgi:serine/threonine-protein phosphatase 4 regulatory subunit 1